MFDVGFLEIAIILVVALLVVGPDRLPGLVRTVGLYVGKARYYINAVKHEVEREIRNEEIMKKSGLDDVQRILNSSIETERPSQPDDYLVKAIDDPATRSAPSEPPAQAGNRLIDEAVDPTRDKAP